MAFISPCLLPMLPVYLSYFTGGAERNTKKTVLYAFGFILGFTAVFVALGAVSGLLGGLLRRYSTAINIATGAIVVLFGLNYIGILKLGFLNKTGGGGVANVSGFFSIVLLGIIFSITWSPCVGLFLGSALAFASQQATAVRGILLLLCFSAGLGLPLLLSAVLIERLKSAFNWIKKHYRAITIVSGVFLVVMGILMMTGLLNMYFDLFTA